MCDRAEGAAGTPAHPADYRFLLGFSYKADFSAGRMGYEQPTDSIRTGYE